MLTRSHRGGGRDTGRRVRVAAAPERSDRADRRACGKSCPTTAPQDEATDDLVGRIRDDVLPAATEGTDIDVLVTGNVAVNVDFSSYLAQRLPYFLVAVLALSFILLMVVFRSLLVPLKAVVMNLLSIGAAYGLRVAVFQWGWFAGVFGVDATGPIEPFIPMMLFAIVFGLSMDYEVFLLSRVKEEYDKGSTNDKAVADGLAATARVITAAAAIMVVRVRQLPARVRPRRQAHGLRARRSRADRRHGRSHGLRARHDGAPRRSQLVAARLAETCHPQRELRG